MAKKKKNEEDELGPEAAAGRSGSKPAEQERFIFLLTSL
jgi:hypothetical protein